MTILIIRKTKVGWVGERGKEVKEEREEEEDDDEDTVEKEEGDGEVEWDGGGRGRGGGGDRKYGGWGQTEKNN